MKALAVSAVSVPVEARKIAVVAVASAFVVAAAFLFGLRTAAAIVAAVGLAVVLERLHRLFHHFRRQGNPAALLCTVVIGLLALVAVGFVVVAAAPAHLRGVS